MCHNSEDKKLTQESHPFTRLCKYCAVRVRVRVDGPAGPHAAPVAGELHRARASGRRGGAEGRGGGGEG